LLGEALSAFLSLRKRLTLDFLNGDTVSEIRLTALVPAGG
jgi:hypothetical protein